MWMGGWPYGQIPTLPPIAPALTPPLQAPLPGLPPPSVSPPPPQRGRADERRGALCPCAAAVPPAGADGGRHRDTA